MTILDARRLKELEAENSNLKQLLADAEVDKAALRDLRPKMVTRRQGEKRCEC